MLNRNFNPQKNLRAGGHPLDSTGLLSAAEGDSPARLFMKAGKTLYDNILKSIIPNHEAATALNTLAYKYAIFGLLKNEETPQSRYLNLMVLTWAAVKGRSTDLALMGMTQIFSERVIAQSSGFEPGKPAPSGNGQQQDEREGSRRERQ